MKKIRSGIKIAIIVPSVNRNAPIKVATEIAKECISHGYQVTILSIKKYPYHSFDGVAVKSGLIALFLGFFCCSVIHSHGFLPDFLSSVFSRFKYIITGKRPNLVSTVHSDFEFEIVSKYGKVIGVFIYNIWRFSLNSIDNVVFLNGYLKNKYSPVLATNISVIYNGLDIVSHGISGISDFSISAPANTDLKVLAYGRLEHVKGFDQLIKAAQLLPNVDFFLFGDGSERANLIKMMSDLQVTNNFHFMGHNDELQSILSTADLVVIPSRSEGFPLALVECMGAGKKILISDIPQFREFSNVFQINSYALDDINDLASKIKLILSERNRFDFKNFIYYEKYLTSAKMFANYLNLYLKSNDD